MTGVGLSAEAIRAPLEAFIARESGARSVCIAALTRLGGGAVQENWRLDAVIDGEAVALVMRTSSATEGVEESLSRADEFALLRAARSAGVTVPEPLWLCTERSVIGRPFHVMRLAPGVSAGHRLVKDPRVGDALAGRLGRELARIHAIRPPRSDLAFLRAPSPTPVQQAIARMRRWLDGHRVPDPALEWALRWLERNEPPCPTLTLVHGDFRTGNYLVADGELTAILDWEFSAWGDPREDIGWFCARCWRFGAVGREAGGIGSRAAFYRGYEAESGCAIAPESIAYWEVMAHVRWAYIALQQGERHLSGADRSLELALTARIVPELRLESLLLIRAIEHGGAHA
ncbi:MAG TPA: phosphotransferase family protein [Alphaproteobacteria bacterium]|nr:phosphotransferase family protein [Alphaproteobacteria bacterium]